MMMPDKFLFGLAIMRISDACSQKAPIEPGRAETKILSIEPTEKAGMRAAQNQPAARCEDTLHFCDQERPIPLWNVLDDFDAGHALELTITKWKLKPIPLPDVRIRKLRLCGLD